MKIQYNGKQVLELSETQKKVIKNDIPSDIFDNDMTRRCKYWLEAPVEKFAHANKDRLIKDLKAKGRKSVPAKLEKLAELYAEDNPCPCGYEGLQVPIECKVGDQAFQLMPPYRKSWRKLGEQQQKEALRQAVYQTKLPQLHEKYGFHFKDKDVDFSKEADQKDKDTAKHNYLKQEQQMLEERMAEILQHKYERCMNRLRLEWEPKLLERGLEEQPVDDDEFAELVFSQPDYLDRSARDVKDLETQGV